MTVSDILHSTATDCEVNYCRQQQMRLTSDVTRELLSATEAASQHIVTASILVLNFIVIVLAFVLRAEILIRHQTPMK